MKAAIILLTAVALFAMADDNDAKMLPDGSGKEIVVRVCLPCHDSDHFRQRRLNRDEWTDMVNEMLNLGAEASESEQTSIVEYLVHNFGPGSKVHINSAPFPEIRSQLGFTPDETTAIIHYREEHGDFKQLSDLLKVPGIDAKKVDAKKDMMAF